MNEVFERPALDSRKTPEENIAVLDRWAGELVMKLNIAFARVGNGGTNGESTD